MLPLLCVLLLFAGYLEDVNCSPLSEAKSAVKEDSHVKGTKNKETNPETVLEQTSHEYAVVEGDMILSDDRNAVGNAWPTLMVPFIITSPLESREHDILAAMQMISETTCVSFKKRTTEKDYLCFITSPGCASYVGYQGHEQRVFIGPPCTVGNIVHEVLHALGFHHEHTRMDREEHITVLKHNVMSGMERNFEKHKGETFNLPYDITSIMHYGSDFFSVNGLPTIIANTDVRGMGQRIKMTFTDITRVRHFYNCDLLENTTTHSVSHNVTSGPNQNLVSQPPTSRGRSNTSTGRASVGHQ